MVRIAVCDDDALHLESVQRLILRELGGRDIQVLTFLDAQALLCAVQEAEFIPDIAVLDIQMPGVDGIELAHKLNETVPFCRIIFLTGFLSYVSDVYETAHAYYVIKSEMEERMGAALLRALAPVSAPEYSLRYRDRASVKAVAVNEVLFLERQLRKTRIAASEEHWTTQPPQELLAGLPEGLFIRCHQSYWVRRGAIKALEQNEFVLKNGARLPISRAHLKQARELFFRSLSAKQVP